MSEREREALEILGEILTVYEDLDTDGEILFEAVAERAERMRRLRVGPYAPPAERG